MAIRLLQAATIVAALMSAYGWWFHFSAGPAHGAGAELGTLAGVVALVLAAVVFWRWPARGGRR